jgi:hypothetical protein
MIEDLTTVSFTDLIAGNHFDDIENFTMFSVELDDMAKAVGVELEKESREQLWGYRPRGKYVKGQNEVQSLDSLMGNKGTLHVKTPADGDELAFVTMKAVGVGGDANFRAKRVAQLAAAYADADENNEAKIPSIQDLYAEDK